VDGPKRKVVRPIVVFWSISRNFFEFFQRRGFEFLDDFSVNLEDVNELLVILRRRCRAKNDGSSVYR
jgi:hypothetical protein